MLKIVIEKPIQLIVVSAVPLILGSALWATMVENKGESAITTIPQKSKNTKNTVGDATWLTHGTKRQHNPESPKAIEATVLGLYFLEM